MKIVDYSNQITKEAIINEFKGNLFEFLVAQGLARFSHIEDQFLLSLPIEFKSKLGSYEELIRTHEPRLLERLPSLAQATVKKILADKSFFEVEFINWNVIGKMVATNESETWNETDIVGTTKDGVKLALSLKLTKDHSFVNTKSAGVKSFFTKYFSGFGSDISIHQKALNNEVDESFLVMGHKLYSMIDSEFHGSFNRIWSDNYTELPGELNPEMRVIVHENYYRVAIKLSEHLNLLKNKNSELFFDSLYALCGFGHADIIQVNCFHQDYELKEITIKKFDDLFFKMNKECTILPLKEMGSSVEIVMGKMVLQIRVKPMNKFTTAAYKINCSIKVRE